jgi:heat shock protein HtpX
MNYFRTALLLAALTGFFLVVGYLLGGQAGLILAFVVALGMNLFAYWNSDKMVLHMSNAQEVGPNDAPELFGIVQDLAQKGGLPMPRVYIIDEEQPNAFATGRDPEHAAVCCTEGILGLLDERELRGVLGHELMHVYNRDILTSSVAAALAGIIMSVAQMLMWLPFFGGDDEDRPNPLVLLAMAILAPAAAMLIQAAISRTREYDADEDGARLTGDPLALASALRKIERGVQVAPLAPEPKVVNASHMMIANPFRAQDVSRLMSTHPPTADRVARLESMAGGRVND